ncbi:putative DNA-binding domain-containing protein [Methylomonas sp. UP202]|uniref:HvfC family RiPP maturation protein n=1 Tax=Methylomonas sp. UP202 TaxID=3040943 RepID=UPI002478FAFE|nr:putative DNA-binding domain-containing protein [Methylomonas sp. UP202]WGS87654.1 putative DNA-binding domain-containing protein [Methylomonas sp. UP202]
MNPTPAYQQWQRHFLNFLRRPKTAQLPAGFDAERVAVYADLLYNKFDESLRACFPVMHSLLSKEDWRALLLHFIAEHRCQTPYYRQIPDEFLRYLQQERQRRDDWPFLAELAHFEWIELQLAIAEAEPITRKPLSDTELLTNVPVFAPVTQLLHYYWPVQDIGPNFLPNKPPKTATHILGFRDSDDQVRFIALNPATAKLILLLNNGLTGQQALQAMRDNDLSDAQFLEFTQFGQRILTELHSQGVVIGVGPV